MDYYEYISGFLERAMIYDIFRVTDIKTYIILVFLMIFPLIGKYTYFPIALLIIFLILYSNSESKLDNPQTYIELLMYIILVLIGRYTSWPVTILIMYVLALSLIYVTDKEEQ